MGKLTGTEELIKALKKMGKTEFLTEIVEAHGTSLKRKAKREASFKGKYTTGNLKRNIVGGMEGKYKYVVEVPLSSVEYAYYVEHGTRKMEAQPYMKPAINNEKPLFEKSIERAVSEIVK